MSDTPAHVTGSQTKSSPDSVIAVPILQNEAPLSFDVLKRECGRKKDPLVKIYLPETTTAAQRNFVFRAFLYFSAIGEVACDDFGIAQANIAKTMIDTIFNSNKSAEQPFVQRYAGCRAVWRFVGYIQHLKGQIWGDDVDGPVLFLAVAPKDVFYPVF